MSNSTLKDILIELDNAVFNINPDTKLRIVIFGFTCFNLDDPLTRLQGVGKNFPVPYHKLIEQHGLQIVYKIVLRPSDDIESRLIKLNFDLKNIEVYNMHPIDILIAKLSYAPNEFETFAKKFILDNKINIDELDIVLSSWADKYKSFRLMINEIYLNTFGRELNVRASEE